MERRPLPSKTVISVGYDAAQQVLELEFAGGRVYRYTGVPEGVHSWLLRTPSKGAYVNRMVVDRYPHEEVTGAGDREQADPGSLLEALRDSLDRAREDKKHE